MCDTELLALTAISYTNFPAFLAVRHITWLNPMECGWVGGCVQAWLLHTSHLWACSLLLEEKGAEATEIKDPGSMNGCWVPVCGMMICDVGNQLLPRQVTEIQGLTYCIHWCFPGGSVIKKPLANAGASGDVGSIPGWGRSFGKGNGNPLQNVCWANPMDRGGWWATVHGAEKSRIQASDWACTHAIAFTSINSLA